MCELPHMLSMTHQHYQPSRLHNMETMISVRFLVFHITFTLHALGRFCPKVRAVSTFKHHRNNLYSTIPHIHSKDVYKGVIIRSGKTRFMAFCFGVHICGLLG